MPCNAAVPVAGGLSARTITDVVEWEALAGTWNDLLSRTPADSPFLTYEWLRAWWDAFGDGAALHILVLCEGERPVCIAPFYRRRRKVLPGLRLPVLRLLGDGLVAERFDCIVLPDREDQALDTLASVLLADTAWSGLCLESLDAASPRWGRLEQRLAESGLSLVSALADLCPYVALPEELEEFRATPDRMFKRLLEEDTRRAIRRHGLEMEVPVAADRVDPLLERLIVLHLETMRARQIRSSLEEAAMQRFLRLVTRAFARRGWLHLAAASLAGEVVAVDYTFIYGGCWFGFQRGCGAAGRAVKAGNALLLAEITSLFGQVRELDCLRGEELYKYYLGGHGRVTRNVFVGRGRLGRLMPWLYRLRLAARGLKRALRS